MSLQVLPRAAAGRRPVTAPTFESLLPRVERLAVRAFRGQRADCKRELVAEVVARAFTMFCRLIERGLGHLAYSSALARYAIRQALSGRRLGTPQNVRDVQSLEVQRKHGIQVTCASGLDRHAWDQVTCDRRATPAEIATLRLDVAAWLERLTPAKRTVVERLVAGDTTGEASRYLGLSAARISQLRRELLHDWNAFHGLALAN